MIIFEDIFKQIKDTKVESKYVDGIVSDLNLEFAEKFRD